MKIRITVVASLFCMVHCSPARQVIELKPVDGDMTPVLRQAIESASDKDLKLIFSPGTYLFRPDYASDKYCFITNHENGFKKIIFRFENFDSVEIEGNGAQLVFHGLAFPFLFENCGQVAVGSLSIDWDLPFNFLGKVVAVNPDEGWRDIEPVNDGFSWKLENGRLLFPNIDGFSFSEIGHSLAFDPETKAVAHGAWDMHSRPEKVEQLDSGVLRFHEKLKRYPPVGSLLNSAGGARQTRYSPGFHFLSSGNIHLEDVTLHYSLGMGFLFERSENAVLSNCRIVLQENSKRVVTTNADATHFCNCKGDILLENCRFENMLDDGINVHGTYVAVDEVLSEKRVRVRLSHLQQMGYRFAETGDDVWFIQQPDPGRGDVNQVTGIKVINDCYTELTFRDPLPENLREGDLLENKTWNPAFTLRGCMIRNHRARNIVLKTPLRTVIENNRFSSMMSSVFFRGETFYWFESGAVTDVLIRSNRFAYCAHGGPEHSVLYITPRLGKGFDQAGCYDRNIRFVDNEIETFDSRIVRADRVDGLVVQGNRIRKTDEASPLHPDAPMFELKNCRNAVLSGNSFEGVNTDVLVADEFTRATLKMKENRVVRSGGAVALESR